jgi:hypothetical protein
MPLGICDEIVAITYSTDSAASRLSIVNPTVLAMDDSAFKDFSGVGKVHPVLTEVFLPLVLIPLEQHVCIYAM